jgi:tRNA-modifying protein YgfZ
VTATTGEEGGAGGESGARLTEARARQAQEYQALHSSAAVHLLPRDVLRVDGVDAESYLQGQCSQDVGDLEEGRSVDALLLSPQGKIDALVRITGAGDDGFVIDTDAGFGSVVATRLERFKLRVKVRIDPLDWTCVAVRGPDSAAAAAAVGRPDRVIPVEWPGLSGIDLLGPSPSGGLSAWVGDEVVRCGDEAWEAARIHAGVPVNGREVVAGAIAAEVGLVDRTVSFTKGCFTGQELVARLDARGSNVARRLCGVVIEEVSPPLSVPVGASVLTADGEHEVGTLSSVAYSPSLKGPIALARLHRRVTPPEAVTVVWDQDGQTRRFGAEARPLPLGE